MVGRRYIWTLGPAEELLNLYGLNTENIIKKAKTTIERKKNRWFRRRDFQWH